MQAPEKWTVLSILRWSTDYLKVKGVEDAKTTVEWLLCETLSCSRMDLYLKFDRPLNEAELAVFKPMLLKCAAKQPVQQVVGNCEFYGLKLAVNDKVLIPRPETERLVDETIRLSREFSGQKNHCADPDREKIEEKKGTFPEADGDITFTPKPAIHILDIGSGSGCIAVALAMHIPHAEITALEHSDDALDVLKRNIHFYNLERRVHIVHADVKEYRPGRSFDLIVSNPPYIADAEIGNLEKKVSHFEPYMALSDTGDGLGFYRLFADRFETWLAPAGAAILEFGGNAQTDALQEIFRSYDRRIVKDYQNDDRVLVLHRRGVAARRAV
jgi:release factor glutamine methyltransferase